MSLDSNLSNELGTFRIEHLTNGVNNDPKSNAYRGTILRKQNFWLLELLGLKGEQYEINLLLGEPDNLRASQIYATDLINGQGILLTLDSKNLEEEFNQGKRVFKGVYSTL